MTISMTRPKLNVRVFVRSTFSDLKGERCRNSFSPDCASSVTNTARFQAIDLRWGVSEEAALDQQTMSICLEELNPI